MYVCSSETESFLSKVKSVQTEVYDRVATGSCKCAQLVESVLIPRLTHWRNAGDVSRTFNYLLESAAAYIYLHNYAKVRVNCLPKHTTDLV